MVLVFSFPACRLLEALVPMHERVVDHAQLAADASGMYDVPALDSYITTIALQNGNAEWLEQPLTQSEPDLGATATAAEEGQGLSHPLASTLSRSSTGTAILGSIGQVPVFPLDLQQLLQLAHVAAPSAQGPQSKQMQADPWVLMQLDDTPQQEMESGGGSARISIASSLRQGSASSSRSGRHMAGNTNPALSQPVLQMLADTAVHAAAQGSMRLIHHLHSASPTQQADTTLTPAAVPAAALIATSRRGSEQRASQHEIALQKERLIGFLQPQLDVVLQLQQHGKHVGTLTGMMVEVLTAPCVRRLVPALPGQLQVRLLQALQVGGLNSSVRSQ